MEFTKLIKFLKILWEKTIAPSLEYLSNKRTEEAKEVKEAVDNLNKTIQSKKNEVVNPNDISDPIVEAQNRTVEAIKAIPSVEIPKTDLTPLEAKMDAFLEALQKKEMIVNVGKTEVEVDTKAVVNSVDKLRSEIKDLKPQEQIDYTLMFDEMMKIMEQPQDQKEIIKLQGLIKKLGTSEDLFMLSEWLRVIAEKPVPKFPKLPEKEGRILVSVDRVGGGGGGLTKIETDALVSLESKVATEDKQLSQIMTRIAVKSDDTEITYVGQAPIGSLSNQAVWKITRFDERVDEVAKFASAGTYNQIWNNRESLTYN